MDTLQPRKEEIIAHTLGKRGAFVVMLKGRGADLRVGSVQTDGTAVELSSEHYEALLKIAGPVREKGRVDKTIVIEVIVHLCSGRYLELRTLAKLLNRSPDSLRNHYINPLIKEGRLEAHFPERPNHPNQAYRAKLAS